MTPTRLPDLLAMLRLSRTGADPSLGRRSPLDKLWAMLRPLWQALTLDDRSEYLGRATDLADLERRMRAWDQAESR